MVTTDEHVLEITQASLSAEQIAAAFNRFRSQVETSAATPPVLRRACPPTAGVDAEGKRSFNLNV